MTGERVLKLAINVLILSFVFHFLPITWSDFIEIIITVATAMAILMVYEISLK